jgi:ATP-dependent Clp protease ATP-binding subunit ClpA
MSDLTYENSLFEEGLDLVKAAASGTLHPTLFREREIQQALEHLDVGRSVLLTGPAGAGKTSVIHGIAHAMSERDSGNLRQLSTTNVLAGTRYIGEWQTKIMRIVARAEESDTVIAFSDIWNLATVGKTSNDPACLLDALRPVLEQERVAFIGEASPEVLRTMQKVPGFVHLFHKVPVAPLPADKIDTVLAKLAKNDGCELDPATRRTLVQLTSRFLPSRPQPGPALNLWRQTCDYMQQKGSIGEPVEPTPEFVEHVFSIYSGLPKFVVSRTETMPAQHIREWFRERIVGQHAAIEAVVESIALFKAGLHDPQRPLGTFLFVGPTGVGKTELARMLATFLFGSESRMLRFDLSEFKDYHSFEMLVGDPGKPDQPARLVDPVRAQPFQVVLFDELEKAHANVWDLFLQLLDEGTMTPPGGQPVSFRNTMIIATSNVGARDSNRSLGFGSEPNAARRDAKVRSALEAAFRPELLNRFQHVVVFHPLSMEQVRTVARQELRRILGREGITARNLVVDVDDAALDAVIESGFDPKYGARALKRELQRRVVLPLAMALMERDIEPASILRVVLKDGGVRVRVIDTAESRASRAERAPVMIPEAGRKLTKDEITATVAEERERIEALAAEADEPTLVEERERLEEARRQPEFWSFPERAALALRDLDRYSRWLGRLDRLRTRATDIAGGLDSATMKREIEDLGNRALQLSDAITAARRELVLMGAEGMWDAIVEVRPLGRAARRVRDFMLDLYRRWGDGRRMKLEILREPTEDDEPVMFALRGHCAFGFLALEHGMHRLRDDEYKGVVSVRVAPWLDTSEAPRFTAHRALKGKGQLGGKLRSRLECEGTLVLQNARTLADNRELAAELAPSWNEAGTDSDEIIRRYDITPFMVRDVLTGFTSGRSDALHARAFHELLCKRVDANAGGEESS